MSGLNLPSSQKTDKFSAELFKAVLKCVKASSNAFIKLEWLRHYQVLTKEFESRLVDHFILSCIILCLLLNIARFGLLVLNLEWLHLDSNKHIIDENTGHCWDRRVFIDGSSLEWACMQPHKEIKSKRQNATWVRHHLSEKPGPLNLRQQVGDVVQTRSPEELLLFWLPWLCLSTGLH